MYRLPHCDDSKTAHRFRKILASTNNLSEVLGAYIASVRHPSASFFTNMCQESPYHSKNCSPSNSSVTVAATGTVRLDTLAWKVLPPWARRRCRHGDGLAPRRYSVDLCVQSLRKRHASLLENRLCFRPHPQDRNVWDTHACTVRVRENARVGDIAPPCKKSQERNGVRSRKHCRAFSRFL